MIIVMQSPITEVVLSVTTVTIRGYKHRPEIGGSWEKVYITAIQNSLSQLSP
jgi:hypothetical protein